jgi:glycosyltransferase involved in cell wall biosynthesis
VVKLSAVVCVQNQEAQLSDCLRKLSFCDEVIVVADRCTDRSQEIARRYGAVVIDGIFPLESHRRMAGVEACSSEWVLEVEPEERIDAALAWEIRAVLQMRRAGDWYELPVDNYVGETLVRHGWTGVISARREPRLYKRGLKSWDARRVRTPVTMAGQSGGALTGAIRRSLGRDVGGLIERLNRFTGLRAEDVVDGGRNTGLAMSMVQGLGELTRAYFVRGGWREGRLGLTAALLSAMSPLIVHMRARDLAEARSLAATQSTETAQPATLRRVAGHGGR